jgi:hypothetical protein
MTPTLLHLFDKVYIDDARYIDCAYWGAVIYEGAADIQSTDPSYNLWRGNNLADALGDSTFLEKMQEIAALDKKFVIYADHSAFAEIVATWLKSITNMDQAAYDKFIDLYCYKRIRTGAENVELLRTALKGAWADAVAQDLSSLNVSNSIEFLFPSVLHDANHTKRSDFKTLMNDFVKRTYEDYILEGKWFIDINFMRDDVQTNLGLADGAALKDETNYHDLPNLAVFKNAWFNNSGSKIPGQNAKVNLTDIPSSDLAAVKTVIDKAHTMMGDVSVEDDWAYLTSAAGAGITDDEFNTILATLISNQYRIPYIPWPNEDSIIFEFLSYVRTLKATNDTATLQKFTLK